MRRFFIEQLDPNKTYVSVTGSEARHMTRVLRMGAGDSLVLMDSTGTRCLASIEAAGSREVRVRIIQTLSSPPPSPVEIVLCQSLLKSRHMDDLVEKASELGADRLIPFASQRTVVRLGADRIPGRCRHWARISRSAAKQSGRGTALEIEPPVSFEQLMEAWNRAKGTKVILWEEEAAQDFKGLLSAPAERFVGVVGPEGGFDTAEIQLAQRAGFTTASLGHRILRAQTAAIAMVALVQFAWGDLGAPPNRVRD